MFFLFTVSHSSVVPTIFINMIGWSAFMYVSQKILHLRMSKVRIYYSHRWVGSNFKSINMASAIYEVLKVSK